MWQPQLGARSPPPLPQPGREQAMPEPGPLPEPPPAQRAQVGDSHAGTGGTGTVSEL